MKYYHQDVEYTKMSHEDEIDLFEKFYAGGRGSRVARDKIIFNHLRLAVMLAGRQVSRGNIPEDEAISAANLGLLKAVKSKRFNPRNPRGIRFAAYARKYIMGSVLKAFKIRRRLVGPPDADYDLQYVPAGIEERPAHDFHDLIGLQTQPDPSDELATKEKKEAIHRLLEAALKKLNPSSQLFVREVIMNGRTLEDVAQQFGTTRQNVSFRLKKFIIPKLRKAFLRDPAFKELL